MFKEVPTLLCGRFSSPVVCYICCSACKWSAKAIICMKHNWIDSFSLLYEARMISVLTSFRLLLLFLLNCLLFWLVLVIWWVGWAVLFVYLTVQHFGLGFLKLCCIKYDMIPCGRLTCCVCVEANDGAETTKPENHPISDQNDTDPAQPSQDWLTEVKAPLLIACFA